ncbi:hypothetical protein CRUP_017776, partial [Coryphaenoides rupestris]
MADPADFPIKAEDGRYHLGGATGETTQPGANMATAMATPPGSKMAEQCLKAVLWQDMSVNLASTLLHQLSERASRAGLHAERMAPPSGCRCHELLVHFKGHRQGNQYRCDRCGHLTRTANKLVEHVRVHTGERPFTCHLCPYSAKRRDSLRLHCKVKHTAAHAAGAVHAPGSYVHAPGSYAHAPGTVHTHRSY